MAVKFTAVLIFNSLILDFWIIKKIIGIFGNGKANSEASYVSGYEFITFSFFLICRNTVQRKSTP